MATDIRLPKSLFVQDKKIRAYAQPGLGQDALANSAHTNFGGANVAEDSFDLKEWINDAIVDGEIDVTGAAGAAVTVDGTQTITGDKTFSGTFVVSGGADFTGDFDVDTNSTITIGDTSGAGNSSLLTINDGTQTITIGGATTLDLTPITTLDVAGLPGPFADDAAASGGGVAVGEAYIVTGGAIHRRLS